MLRNFNSLSSFLKEQTSLPIIVLTSDKTIVSANELFLKISGFKISELKGNSILTMLANKINKEFETLLEETDNGNMVTCCFNFYAKKGIEIESKITFWKQKKDNLIVGIVNLGEDLTRLQQEIDAVNRISDLNLKKLFKTNEKLNEARKAEQEALKTKENFLTSISHELRTPLTGILGITQLLVKTNLNTKQKDYVGNILRSSENLMSIISELLDLSKIKSGKFELHNSAFSLHECLKNTAAVYSIISSNKKINFNFLCDKKIPHTLIGDSMRINQIINNLLNNAFKFTHQGYINLFVRLKKIESKVAHVDFEITDTGIGMNAEKINHIFEEFSQAETATANLYGGTGLGLSIVKHLVKLYNGEIYVKSSSKIGSSFYFTLEFEIGKKEKVIVKKQRLKGLNILVADDNLVNILLIENILNTEGARVFSAHDGKEAYMLFKKNALDILLIDLNMPKMDGFELINLLRNTEKTKVPIIAITAFNSENIQKKCYDKGFTDIIFKPFINEDFVNRVEKFFTVPYTKNEINSVKFIEKSTNQVALDFSIIESITGSNSFLFNNLINSIILNIKTEIPKLNQAIEKLNLKKIFLIAHKIKTSYGYVGKTEELKTLTKIENIAENNGEVKKLKLLFEKIFKEHTFLLKDLEKSLR